MGSAGPVSLARLLEATVSVHPSVRAKQGELQAAGFDLDGANWGWFPTVSSEVQADDGSRAAAVQVQQPLWTGGRIPGQIDLATANREAASAAVIEAEQQVMLSVGVSFYEFLRQQARIEIARSNEAEHSKLLEMIRRRVRAEVSPQSDQTLAAARFQQALAERLQFERALKPPGSVSSSFRAFRCLAGYAHRSDFRASRVANSKRSMQQSIFLRSGDVYRPW